MKKKSFLFIPVIAIAIFLGESCGKCGKSIKLGDLPLAASSREFIPYNGNEELIFMDNLGVEHKLHSVKGKELTNTRSNGKALCLNGALDYQYEYYDSQMEEIAYEDLNNKTIFWIQLSTIVLNDEVTDENTIFDYLNVNVGIYNSNYGISPFTGSLNIITREIQNQLTPEQKELFEINNRYIGDTILYNRNFQNVYTSKVEDSSKNIYYNKSKGLIALGTTDEFWVLSN